MKTSLSILLIFCFLAFSCEKSEETPISGEVTIDNTVHTSDSYYYLGFNFSLAAKVSTLADPDPDITVGVKDNAPCFEANAYKPPFSFRAGYESQSEALTVFDALRSFDNLSLTWSDFGYPLAENQIWILRDGDGHFAKILITDIMIDYESMPVSVTCTFKWVYQPDGSTTFTE